MLRETSCCEEELKTLSILKQDLSTLEHPSQKMCGIAGQLSYLRQEQAAHEVVRRMANSIVHRGPDDEGYFFSGPLAFGFRRLSIIDRSGGHQPMSNADEKVWVIYANAWGWKPWVAMKQAMAAFLRQLEKSK